MKICNTCAWYCHADGNCYATAARLSGLVPASKPGANNCESWTFDGLEEWEREACKPDALVTMEEDREVYVPVINMQGGIPVYRMQKVAA